MVAKDFQNKIGSPVGEIDTRAPFQSVKDAVNLFVEGAFSGDRPIIMKTKPNAAERVLAKEKELHMAQKELSNLKEQVKSAETTKAEAVVELERGKRTLQDLTNELQTVNKAKESAIKAMETANQFGHGQTDPMGDISRVWKRDWTTTKEQYDAVIIELNAAKQELRKIRQDHEAAMGQKSAALEQATEAELTAKANLVRAGELSKEIASVQECIEQVKLAIVDAQQERAKTYAEKNVQKLSHEAALEESAKKLIALRKETNPEISKGLKTQLAETESEIGSLLKEMESSSASDLGSLKNIMLELNGAKESLQKLAEEENSLKSLLDSLEREMESVKKEHAELKEKEAEMESIASNLHVMVQKSKSELEAACLEAAKAEGTSDQMVSTLKQLSLESENAKREAEEMKRQSEELKKEAEAIRVASEEAESKLRIALEETKEVKAAEAKAVEEIKLISERTDAARTSTSKSSSRITISKEEFESLNRKVEESHKLADMKVGAAMAQVEAVKASENEALKRLETIQKEINEVKAATDVALKRTELAEAAKKAVEGELLKWREREQKKAVEAASRILQDPPILKQNPPQKVQKFG